MHQAYRRSPVDRSGTMSKKRFVPFAVAMMGGKPTAMVPYGCLDESGNTPAYQMPNPEITENDEWREDKFPCFEEMQYYRVPTAEERAAIESHLAGKR